MSELAPWVASCSPSWRRRRIRTVGRTASGSGFPPAHQGEVDLDIPFYKVKHLGQASPDGILGNADDTISYETAESLGATIFPAGTLVYAKVGAALILGRVRILPADACIDNNMAGLIPSGELEPRFLYWAMSQIKFDYLVNPGAVPSLSDKNLLDFPLLIPSRDEQRAIAAYLDRETARIDTLIGEQQRLIEMLRERRDGVVTKAFLNSTSEERSLKFVVDDVTVGIVVQPSRWYVDVGVPALRGVNIKRGSISFSDLVHISEEGHAAHPKSKLCSGDVVVVRTGHAGAAAKIPDELDGANAIDVLIVRPGEGIDPDFLVWYLNSPLAASRIEHGSVGALQGHFNVSALRELPLPDVSLAEQQRIVAYLDEQIAKIDTMIAETERFVELARERRSALIAAAVTGQIDVREMRDGRP